jgi:DNA polymerase III epsilon subunit family exonuclease
MVNKEYISLNDKRQLLEFKDFAVLDFETTGFPPDADITEIGCVKVLGGKPAATFSTLVNPLRVIPANVVRLTGITNEMVRGAPTIYDIMKDLHEFLDGLPVVAYNAGFDIGFLAAAYNKCGFEAGVIKYIDALQYSRKAYPKLINHKLGTVIAHFGLSDCQTHRALDDALCTMKHFLNCLEIIAERC